METIVEIVDLRRQVHRQALLHLLNDYMLDDMGKKVPFDASLHAKVLSDLEAHSSYIGFLLKAEKNYVALANCFVNYSTFRVKHVLNIHDYVVSSAHRGKGYGQQLLTQMIAFSKKKGYCRINLEVREDNTKAKGLYQKLGFDECQPRMFFWEREL